MDSMTDTFTVAILAAVAGGVAGETAKALAVAAKGWVDRFNDEHGPVAAEKAEKNAASFVGALASRVATLEAADAEIADRFRSALQDPDVAATLRTAVLGAARSGSSERHRILVDSVVERLRADEGSTRAVASAFAVEILPRLAGDHLFVLGLLAVIYGIRGRHLYPDSETLGDEWKAAVKAALPFAVKYKAWLDTQLAPYAAMPIPSLDLFSHLSAAGCLTFDLGVHRDLVGVLSPGRRTPESPDHAWLDAFFAVASMEVRKADAIGTWSNGWLGRLWESSLQHGRPTPAGLLIGCAVHDAKTGSNSVSDWEWSDTATPDAVVRDPSIWDGDRLNSRFAELVAREVSQRS